MKLVQLVKKIICLIKGHNYPGQVFHYNVLMFCRCCGKEIAGRIFADLEPMTQEEWEDVQDGFGDEVQP